MSQCPRCRTPLVSDEYEGVPLAACPQCKGQWVDRAGLRAIIDIREKSWDEAALKALERAPMRGVKLDTVREDLPCPSCGGVMEAFHYGGDTGIILDKCRPCGGIWLDGGELEKVQMVVESSDMDLAADAKRFSGDLRLEADRQDKLEQRDYDRSGAPLMTAIVDRYIDPGE